MNTAEHIATLQAFLRADYEEHAAQLQSWIEDAIARGDIIGESRYRESLEQWESMPKSWK